MSRAEYLESLPTEPMYFDPCRCRGEIGWRNNPVRKMWVCSTCNKPSGLHRAYCPLCFECGEVFTHTIYPGEDANSPAEKYPFCPKCS